MTTPAHGLDLLSVYDASKDLLDCVCTYIDRIPTEIPGLAGCPCRKMVVPGAPAADGCDGGCGPVGPGEYPGQLTVNVVRVYSTDRQRFPLFSPSSPDSVRDTRTCIPQIMAVDLNVTLWRCAPLPTDQGCPPTPESLTLSAMQLSADMMAVQQAILCCYSATDETSRRGRRYTLGQSLALGPQGGCVGLEQGVTVALDDPLCCPTIGA